MPYTGLGRTAIPKSLTETLPTSIRQGFVIPGATEAAMSLDLTATLRPDDLTTAHDRDLLEYLAGVNADAKRMSTNHLRYGLRHAQLNAVLSELERRTCLRLLSA